MDIVTKTPVIKLEHGSGGALSRELVEHIIYPLLKSDIYSDLSDATLLGNIADPMMTTDTYVIDPPMFPGGDIGELAVFGTSNDLAVSGGKPLFLSMGLVLEEGFSTATLRDVVKSAASAARKWGVTIVTGDTKVVPAGKGGGIFINTTGIGERMFKKPLSPERIGNGDEIVVSGPVGSHGISILAAREKLSVGSSLESDCAFLYPLCESLFALDENLRFMRDATRGGIAAILNEITQGRNWGIDVKEHLFPITQQVKSVSEILGLNPLEVANEGVFVAVVAPGEGRRTVGLLNRFKEGAQAQVVGSVTSEHPGKVILETSIGGRRILDFPRGLLLPRIC